MNTFAFIGHYLSIEHGCQMLGQPGRLVRRLPYQMQKDLIRTLPPYTFLRLPPLTSSAGSTVQGYAIIAPFLPEHLVTWGEEPVLNKIIHAGRLAQRLGAHIVGLAGFTSIVGNEGQEVAEHLKIAVTSGNTFTAAMALQGLRRAARLMGIPWESATVAVIGATGDIGSACTRVLAREVGRLNLAARNAPRLEEFASVLPRKSGCAVQVVKYVKDAVRDADLILTATSAVTTLIEPQDLKPGAVVCDVAVPHNVGIDLVRQRNDVLVFEGGLARLPVSGYLNGNRNWSFVSSDGVTIFGCLAESIILALDGRLENYSIGRGHITPEHIREIEQIASRHGFTLADFRYGNITFDEERIRVIRAHATRHDRDAITEPIRVWSAAA